MSTSDGGVDAKSDAPPAPPIEIVCGAKHACILRSDGAITCWGRRIDGKPLASAPVGPFLHISAGISTCGLRTSGDITCWGLLGDGSVPAGPFSALSMSEQNACGLRASGDAACWYMDVPRIDYPPPPTQLRLVRAGGGGPCGLRASDGFPVCWAVGSPTPAPQESMIALSVGTTFACGIGNEGTIACWGVGNNGELTFPNGVFTDVKAQFVSACAQRTDGTLECWGSSGIFQQKLTSPAGTFREYCVGEAFGCGIHADNNLACWGFNDVGQASPP